MTDRGAALKPAPSRTRRWTVYALFAVAVISILTAGLFLKIWSGYVDSLEPDFAHLARLWGEGLQNRLEKYLDDYVDSQVRIGAWRDELPRQIAPELARELERNPVYSSLTVALEVEGPGGRRVPAVLVGEPDEAVEPGAWSREAGSEVEVAAQRRGEQTQVFVRGPLSAKGPVHDHYSFRALLEFPSFRPQKDRGTQYAAALVILYLGMLYVLGIAIFFIGRREMTLAFSAKEKEIRLRAISSVAEGIAHEVRNPLNAISLNVQYLERLQQRPESPPSPQDYQRVYMELGKIRKVIDNFVSFASLRDIELTEWDLNEAVDEAITSCRKRLVELGIDLQREGDPRAIVTGDRPKIVQVLSTVVVNAIDAVAVVDERSIHVRVEDGRQEARVRVFDSGDTPSPKVLRSMFDPYFTTRSSAMGLGLTLARTVVESHGGRIEAQAVEGGGCLVEVVIPKQF